MQQNFIVKLLFFAKWRKFATKFLKKKLSSEFSPPGDSHKNPA